MKLKFKNKQKEAIEKQITRLHKQKDEIDNICENCGVELIPTTRAYVGFSSSITICTDCTVKFEPLPITYNTIEFVELGEQ